MASRSVVVGGKTRTYIIYLPASADPTAPMPFVYVFHGYLMSGQDMYDITQYTAIADAEGIGLRSRTARGGPTRWKRPGTSRTPGRPSAVMGSSWTLRGTISGSSTR